MSDENFNGNAEVQENKTILIANQKDNKKKNFLIALFASLAIAGIIVLFGKGKKDNETKKVRVIKRTKTIIKDKKGVIESEEDEEDNGEENGHGEGDDNRDTGDTNGAE